jgi:uncharacterized protein (TIGR02266 family)
MGDSRERRNETRHHARFDVRFHSVLDAAKAFNTFSTNFSAGGLCILAKAPLPVGEPLALSVTINSVVFNLEGEVVWSKGNALGVRFTRLSSEVRSQLQRLVLSAGPAVT